MRLLLSSSGLIREVSESICRAGSAFAGGRDRRSLWCNFGGLRGGIHSLAAGRSVKFMEALRTQQLLTLLDNLLSLSLGLLDAVSTVRRIHFSTR